MTRSLRHTATLALAAAALAAPSASARPADPPAHKQARVANHAATYPTRPSQGEQAFPKPDPPVPKVIPAQPTADRGPDWTTIGLGISGGLLALAGIAWFAHRSMRSRIAV